MAHYRLVALTNPVPGREDEYNDWYDNQHLGDVLNVPGFYSAQRFVAEDALSPEPPTHKYMAIYGFESDDLAKTAEYFVSITNTDKMPISPALNTDASPAIYRVLGPLRERADKKA
jgi:hypothetical protein